MSDLDAMLPGGLEQVNRRQARKNAGTLRVTTERSFAAIVRLVVKRFPMGSAGPRAMMMDVSQQSQLGKLEFDPGQSPPASVDNRVRSNLDFLQREVAGPQQQDPQTASDEEVVEELSVRAPDESQRPHDSPNGGHHKKRGRVVAVGPGVRKRHRRSRHARKRLPQDDGGRRAEHQAQKHSGDGFDPRKPR